MVSNIGDQWQGNFPNKFPQWTPQWMQGHPSQAEFDALRDEVLELKKLLKAASDFDKATGQPHCEMESKIKLIKEIAKLVGVDFDDIFEEKKST